MKDYKFLIGLQLYLIIIHYSIFVGYVYANYNVMESVMISTLIGILAPFFIPIHYILDFLHKEKLQNIEEDTEIYLPPLISFKYLCSKYEKIKPIKNRV
jgi:hypothetical protein